MVAAPVLRPICIYVIALVIVRLMGKRALGELCLFDLVIMAGIGDVITTIGLENRTSLSQGLFFLGILGGLEILFSLLSYRFPKLSKMIEGSPTLLIKNGRIIDRNLRMENISLHDLQQEMRRQGIEDMNQVQRAVFEASGHFSFVLKKDNNQAVDGNKLEIDGIREELRIIRGLLENREKGE